MTSFIPTWQYDVRCAVFSNIRATYEALCSNDDFKADDKKNLILQEVAAIDGVDEQRSDHEFFVFLKENQREDYQGTEETVA